MRQIYIIYKDKKILEAGYVNPGITRIQTYIDNSLKADPEKQILYLKYNTLPDIAQYEVIDKTLSKILSDTKENEILRELNISTRIVNGMKADTETLLRLLALKTYAEETPYTTVKIPCIDETDNSKTEWKDFDHKGILGAIVGLGKVISEEYKRNADNDL